MKGIPNANGLNVFSVKNKLLESEENNVSVVMKIKLLAEKLYSILSQ
jgi:hypothetical protein